MEQGSEFLSPETPPTGITALPFIAEVTNPEPGPGHAQEHLRVQDLGMRR
jgi:hypothetical protein